MSATINCIVFFVVTIAIKDSYALTEDQKTEIHTKLMPLLKECGESNGLSMEDVTKMKDMTTIEDSQACFVACLYKKMGLIDGAGLYSADEAIAKAKNYATDEEMSKIVAGANKCTEVNDAAVGDVDKGCERAKLLFNCFIAQKDILSFVI